MLQLLLGDAGDNERPVQPVRHVDLLPAVFSLQTPFSLAKSSSRSVLLLPLLLAPPALTVATRAPVPSRQFTHREFALTLPNDVYIRYNSFATAEDMKKEIVRMNPARFEIGPVYTGRVSTESRGSLSGSGGTGANGHSMW